MVWKDCFDLFNLYFVEMVVYLGVVMNTLLELPSVIQTQIKSKTVIEVSNGFTVTK